MLLDRVSWEIQQGEQWAILGANGSGKTSLLNLLSGYLQPTSGEVSVLGEIFGETDWSQLRQVIGVINHTVSDWIQPDETALEIVVGGIHGQINYWGRITPSDRETALAVMGRYGFAYAADRTWLQMSQGERQRTLICRAITSQLRVLILDEPCAGLDPISRAGFLQFIESMASSGKKSPALILVTHHLEEITPSFTHVMVLKKGKVLAAGPKHRILRSEILSEAFDASVRVRKRGLGHALDLL